MNEIEHKELGIYIHIPFCKQKCYYCDFVSFAGIENEQEQYIDCLKKELINEQNIIKENSSITTIYIGGGTPSYIEEKYIIEIMELLQKYNADEITIEVNPGTVTEQKLTAYKEAGINRLSIGLQSAKDKLLEEIGRIHNYEQFIETYNLARKVGFDNINVDLMLGLPNQSIEDLKDSLTNVSDLNPQHISVYSLILEEGTKLYELVNNKKLELPSEELERNMYWYTKSFLELKGYKHYEISNFAKPGFESKHNVNCWKQKEYIGIGLNSSSYFEGIRYSNTSDLRQYMKNIENGEYKKNRIIEETQNELDKKQEFMLLGLRMIDGVSIQEYKKKFGANPLYEFRDKLNKLVEDNLLEIDGDKIRLSKKGVDLANKVWEEFV